MPSGWLLCSMLACAPAAASEAYARDESGASSVITVGNRIRLLAPTVASERIQGTVVGMDSTALTIARESGARLAVPRDAVTRLEVFDGRRRQTLAGVLLGAALGAVVVGSNPCVNEGCAHGFSGEFAAIGAVGGSLWGGIVGALVKRDHWSAVALDDVRVTLGPTEGRGVRVSVSVGF